MAKYEELYGEEDKKDEMMASWDEMALMRKAEE